MGIGYILHCPDCSYKIEVFLGIGMLYSSLENVVDQLHPRRRAEVWDILQNHSVDRTDYWMALYRCGKCGQLYNRLYARIEYDRGEVYETLYKCPKCRVALTDVPHDFDATLLRCPSCKEHNLEVIGGCMWD